MNSKATENVYATIAHMALSGYTFAEATLTSTEVKELEAKGFKIFSCKKDGAGDVCTCKVYWHNPSIKNSLAVDMLLTAIRKLVENYESMS